jgi:hypothetical protein
MPPSCGCRVSASPRERRRGEHTPARSIGVARGPRAVIDGRSCVGPHRPQGNVERRAWEAGIRRGACPCRAARVPARMPARGSNASFSSRGARQSALARSAATTSARPGRWRSEVAGCAPERSTDESHERVLPTAGGRRVAPCFRSAAAGEPPRWRAMVAVLR